ncbi:MAG: immunoglobulin domain-containing protein [Verrucomicrobiaceae bacterium]|nr:immunoglobulin domain-containing protein [Verrucomicrobiaceae bacterium]
MKSHIRPHASALRSVLKHFRLVSAASLVLLFSGANGSSNAQSVLDPSFNPNVGISSNGTVWTTVYSLSIMPGKRILVGGHFSTLGLGTKALYRGSFARLADSGIAEDGLVSYPWAPLPYTTPLSDSTSDPWVWSTHLSSFGEMLVMGNFTEFSGDPRNQIAIASISNGSSLYYNAPLVMDHPNYRPEVTTGWLLPTGEPIYVGDWNTADGVVLKGIAKQIGSDGEFAADGSFNPNLLDNGAPESVPYLFGIIRQPDGKIIISGTFDTVRGEARPYLVRLNDDSTIDPTFNHSLTAPPTAMVLQPDGKLLVATGLISRLNANGTNDSTFAPAIVSFATSMVLRADGKVVVGGPFTDITPTVGGTTTRNGVAMLTSTGLLDAAFNPNVGLVDIQGTATSFPSVMSLAIQTDGKVVIGGGFGSVSGQTRRGLARMTADVPAISDLEISNDRTTVTWTRGGSAPEIMDVKFSYSNNGGTTYISLPPPTYIPGTGWQLGGQLLPQGKSFQFRAIALTSSGWQNGSTGYVERVLKPIADFSVGQPVSITVNEGQSAVFSVEARSSLPIISYQWKRNGVNLVDGPDVSGATTDTLTLNPATSSDAGTYTVVVKTLGGSATSEGARLTVIVPPSVVTDPVDLVVGRGKSAKFTAKFAGSSPTYLWAGPFPVNASGKTGLTLSFNNAQDIHEGNYTVTATNAAGSATSGAATLTVVDPPIVGALSHQIVGVGDAPVLSATVSAEAPASLRFQWLRGTTSVAGATTASHTLNNIQLGQAGSYALRATNPAGAVTGTKGEIAVVDDINEKTQVQKATATAILTAAASGNSLTYVWKFTPLGGGPTQLVAADGIKYFLSGGGKTLTIKGLTTGDAGDYIAEVTAPGGMLATAPEHLFVTTGQPTIMPLAITGHYLVNEPISLQVMDNGIPTEKPASYTMKSTPNLSGVSISKLGLITGRASKAGTYTLSIIGSNGQGKSVPITATLVIDPIPTNAIGNFIGIVSRGSHNANLGGRLDLSVTPIGSYSGKLQMGGTSFRFSKGSLTMGANSDSDLNTTSNPSNVISIPRTGTTPLTLTFDLNLVNNTVSGTVTDGVTTSDLDGWRQVWSASNNPVTTANFLGRINFALSPPAELPAQTYPHGHSYGSALVPASGSVTTSGVLADGVAFSTAGFLGPQGQLAIFRSLYSNTGSLVGAIQIAVGGASVADYGQPGPLNWMKKDQAPKIGYNYNSGFSAITLAVEGSLYPVVPPGANVLGSDVTVADTRLNFEDAGLGLAATNPDVDFTLTGANLPVFTTNLGKVKVNVDKKTGVFSGDFSITDDIDPGPAVVNVKRTGKYYGVVLRNAANTAGTGKGYFLLPQLPVLPGTSTAVTPILSGPVLFTDITP